MNNRTLRLIAATTMLTVASSSVGCGFLLYPQRRGNSTEVDSRTLVMDLLWLLPGLIPGVVALIVDFSSGAIYLRGGKSAVLLSPDGRVAVRLPRAPTPTRVEFRLVTDSERVLAHQSAVIGPATPDGQSVELRIGDALRSKGASTRAGTGPSEEIYLELRTEDGATARFPTAMRAALGT